MGRAWQGAEGVKGGRGHKEWAGLQAWWVGLGVILACVAKPGGKQPYQVLPVGWGSVWVWPGVGRACAW